METLRLDVPEECSNMVVLLNGRPIPFNSTNEIKKYVEKMRLRITGTSKQGKTYLVLVQREDSSL